MTLMSYVDNSVEIGDFFSYYVKNVEEMEKLCTFLICKLIGEKIAKILNESMDLAVQNKKLVCKGR